MLGPSMAECQAADLLDEDSEPLVLRGAGNAALAPGPVPAWFKAVVLGLAVTAAQVTWACLWSGQRSPAEAYERLFHWDGPWYATVMELGYVIPASPDPPKEINVAFFPGYPLVARWIKSAFHLRIDHALLVTAQFGCWGLWTYVILFFQRWRISGRLALLGVVSIVSHPGSFFVVASYSEPLFLMALLGFLFWSDSPCRRMVWLAAAHGFVMTATRFVGFPLIIYPLCRHGPNKAAYRSSQGSVLKRFVPPLLIGVMASLGTLSFFAYCHARFGQWDLYMRANEAGWNVKPNYLGVFSRQIFRLHKLHWEEKAIDPEFLSQLWVSVTALQFAGLFVAEWRLARTRINGGWRERFGFYLCAGLMFYVSLAAHVSRCMSSMIRFTVCVHLLLALASVHLLHRWPLSHGTRRWRLAGLVFWNVVSLSLQGALTYRFTHGLWVA
jgi:hypothetical protein